MKKYIILIITLVSRFLGVNEHLHFGFGVHDFDRVAIRLSENDVLTVIR
jgi:hypothetical protein